MMEAPLWLNKKFVEGVLRQSENDDSICVIEISTLPAMKKGEGYLSQMIRVNAEFNRNIGSEIINEKRSLIAKFLPSEENIMKILIEMSGLFDVEIEMMTTTLKEMNSILQDTKLSPDCLFTQKQNPSILIIEDLVSSNFRMADRQAGLDLQHCLLALKNLAKFHASSVAVYEKKPEYKTMYKQGNFSSNYPLEVKKFYVHGMKDLAKVVATWPGLGQSYSNKIMNIADVIYDRASKCEIPNSMEFNVINHGDVQVNNMFFKYDNEGKVIDHIFIDFQMCLYGSPAIDLSYFLDTSPSDSILQHHKNEIIEEYLKVLTSTMHKLKCKTQPPTMSQLQKSMDRMEVYGMLAACTLLPLFLAKKDQTQDFEEIMDQDDSKFNKKAYDNDAYRVTMSRRLIRWDAMGLLDL